MKELQFDEQAMRNCLINVFANYFSIGDSYTYELTRSKEAFEIGTMGFDDFIEWEDENIFDLADYVMANIGEEYERMMHLRRKHDGEIHFCE